MKRTLILLGVALASVCSAASAEVVVASAWVRAAPPGAAMLAGYVTLRNDADAAARVVAAESDAFEAVEMHRTEEVDGVSRMREVQAIEVPAHGEAVLAPGGLHLMLMRPRAPLAEGDSVAIRFRLADGGVVEADFPVRRGAEQEADTHPHHHHH